MNNQTWVKTVTQNRKKCEKIMAISKDIRYAGVFNEFGRTIAGKIRPGIKPIFSPDTVPVSYTHLTLPTILRV